MLRTDQKDGKKLPGSGTKRLGTKRQDTKRLVTGVGGRFPPHYTTAPSFTSYIYLLIPGDHRMNVD